MRLAADANVSGSRDERVWEQRRMRLGAEALTGIGNGGRSTVVRLAGRVRGGLCSIFRGTSIIAFFAKYLSSFTLRKVSYSASLFFGNLENSSVRPYLYAKSVSNVKIILTAYLLFVNLQAILWKVMVGECFPLASRSRFPSHRKAETARIGAFLTAPS